MGGPVHIQLAFADGSLKFEDRRKGLALHSAFLHGEGARQKLLKRFPIEGGITAQLKTPVLCDLLAKTAGWVTEFYSRSQFSAFARELSIRKTTKERLIRALRSNSGPLEWKYDSCVAERDGIHHHSERG